MKTFRSYKFGVRSIGVILAPALLAGVALATDWSNPNAYAPGVDAAGEVVRKHESNFTDLYQATTGKLNQLKGNFAGTTAPTGPNAGQSWADTTNKLMQWHDGTSWGAMGVKSSGTFSWSGPMSTSGTGTHTGPQIVTGDINSSGTNTWSGPQNISGSQSVTGNINSSGTNTWSGANVFSDATGTIRASSVVFTGEVSAKNGGSVAINSALTQEIITLDLGTVTSGDRIDLSAYAFGVKSGGAGPTGIYLEKSSGTATIAFLQDKTVVGFSTYLDATRGLGVSLRHVVKVTGSGTLIMRLSGTSTGSDFTISAGDGQIGAFFLTRQ